MKLNRKVSVSEPELVKHPSSLEYFRHQKAASRSWRLTSAALGISLSLSLSLRSLAKQETRFLVVVGVVVVALILKCSEGYGSYSKSIYMSDQHPRSAFVARLCAMASDSENLFPGCCSWGLQGDSFQIHDKETFQTRVLPHYSSSSNLKSFIRQLNRHGFRKERRCANVIE